MSRNDSDNKRPRQPSAWELAGSMLDEELGGAERTPQAMWQAADRVETRVTLAQDMRALGIGDLNLFDMDALALSMMRQVEHDRAQEQ